MAVVAFIAIVVRWFLKEHRNTNYIQNNDRVFNDFYTLGKRFKQ